MKKTTKRVTKLLALVLTVLLLTPYLAVNVVADDDTGYDVSGLSPVAGVPQNPTGNSARYGDTTWKDYVIKFDLTNVTLSGGWPWVQVFMRINGNNDFWAAVTGTNSDLYGDGIAGGLPVFGRFNQAAIFSPGDILHYEFDVIGDTIICYINSERRYTYVMSQDLAEAMQNGGIGWATNGLSARITNLQVYLLETGELVKAPITIAAISDIKAPVAGIYPTSRYMYNYNNPNPGGDNYWRNSSRYAETITWDPPVNNTFQTDTQYTAIDTLSPINPLADTFKGFDVSTIGNLPTENVTATEVFVDGDNLVIKITFAPTGSAAAVFKEDEGLLFYDEFDGDSLDTSKWSYSIMDVRSNNNSGWGHHELVTVEDGHLALGMRRDPDGGWGYRNIGNYFNTAYTANSPNANFLLTGAVQTGLDNRDELTFENAYGFYEASIKFPTKIPGTWGAFWLYEPSVLSDKYNGLDGSEIDIIESIGHANGVSNHAIHWDGYGSGHAAAGINFTYNDYLYNIYDGNFHNFAVQWTPSEYIFYIDGKEMWRVDGGVYDRQYNTGKFSGICQNPLHILLSVEKGSGALPEDFEYDEMLVDYVRVYDRPKYTVTLDLAPVFDKDLGLWQIEATLNNSGAAQTGVIAFEDASQEYSIAPNSQSVYYFDLDSAKIAGAGSVFLVTYTTSGGAIGSASLKFGAINATEALEPANIDGSLEEDVWTKTTSFNFRDGTIDNMRPEVDATGSVSWDKDNLYIGVTADTPDLNQNYTGGNIWQGDNIQVAVRGKNGYREMGFALNPDQGLQQWCWGADGSLTDGNNTIPADMAEASIVRDDEAGATIYEVAIKWAYLGLTPDDINVGELFDIALVLNDASSGNSNSRGYMAIYDGIATGSKGQGMGKLSLIGATLAVDKSNLIELTALAETLVETTYTADSWSAMQTELASAYAVIADDVATQDAVDDAYTELSTAIENLVIYVPVIEYEVTFNSDGGTSIMSQNVEDGEKAVEPINPQKKGFVFTGWYLDNDMFDFDSPITSDITLTAFWTVAQSNNGNGNGPSGNNGNGNGSDPANNNGVGPGNNNGNGAANGAGTNNGNGNGPGANSGNGSNNNNGNGPGNNNGNGPGSNNGNGSNNNNGNGK